jgi:hypothetical protein
MFFSKGAPSDKRSDEHDARPSSTEWPTIEGPPSSRGRFNLEKSDADVVYPFGAPGERIRTTEPEALVGSPPLAPTLAPPPIPTSDTGRLEGAAPTGHRLSSRLYWYVIATLAGVALTLNWQTFGDEAIKSISGLAPSLEWLAPTKSSAYDSMPADIVAVTLPELRDQVEPLARSLATMRQTLEDLAAKQEQMVQSIAALRATEREVLDKIAAVTTSQAQAVSAPPPPSVPPPEAARISAPRASSVPVRRSTALPPRLPQPPRTRPAGVHAIQ